MKLRVFINKIVLFVKFNINSLLILESYLNYFFIQKGNSVLQTNKEFI
jgi:hypothetical protein